LQTELAPQEYAIVPVVFHDRPLGLLWLDNPRTPCRFSRPAAGSALVGQSPHTAPTDRADARGGRHLRQFPRPGSGRASPARGRLTGAGGCLRRTADLVPHPAS
jgi:hypothetical protein